MADIKKLQQQINDLAREAKRLYGEMEADETRRTPENREKLDKMIADGKALREELERAQNVADLNSFVAEPASEPKAAGSAAGAERKTIGERVVESAQFKNANRAEGKMAPVAVGNLVTRLATKAVYNAADAQGGFTVRADREPEILDIARRRPSSVLDLITVGQTSVDAVEYILLTSRTNNSAVVPEWDAAKAPGAGDYNNKFGDKPQGDLQFDLKTAIVKTIAEWIPASRQILADVPNLRSMIDQELMYQIEYALENQIVAGDGTGNNFTGILNTSGIQARAHKTSGRNFSADDTIADTLRKAITDIALAFYDADGIVINPQEGEKLELEKGSDGHYVMVYDPVAMRLWRKPVRETQAIPTGTAIVGALKLGVKLWDREQSNVRVGEPGNFFLQNAVAILAELRAAFAVTRPQAIEKVTGL